MYPFRANKSNSQESFFVLLVDGTTSMNAHYPIFLKCFHKVFNSIKHKLAFQFGISQDRTDSVLYDINKYLDHRESNFNKVFKQLFEILITQHIDKKYLTICFISDGVEPFIFDDFLPLVKQITSVFQIQFASIAVGKNFPTLISNQLRERLHNNGNLDFPFIYQVMDQGQIRQELDNYNNVIINPQDENKIIQEFTDAFESLKQQLIVYTGNIELNEIVYKSFIQNEDQATNIVQCNQVFLSTNPTVETKNNQVIQCSQDVEDFTQIQKGSIQQLLIHLQANNKIEDSQKEFKKLLDISTKSQRLLVQINQQKNPIKDQQQINNHPILNVMNELMNQFVQTNYVASLKNNENEYAQLQANLEKNPEKCIKKSVEYSKSFPQISQCQNIIQDQPQLQIKDIEIQPIQHIQLEQKVQKKQNIQHHQQNINEVKLNSKLIILIDSFKISELQAEDIINQKKTIFDKQEEENVLTLWWADTIQQIPKFNSEGQQIPLTQAIQQILSIIEQDQSGIKNFIIWLIISGQHKVDFLSLKQQQQQIQQQNKQIAFTTLIIENNQQNDDIKMAQLKLSLELRRQLHTNYQTHSLQVSARVKTQEFHSYLNQYFRMVKDYQNKFYRIQKKGCYLRGITLQKNAMHLLKQFINDIEHFRQQLNEDMEFIQILKQIKQKYYKMMNNFKEQEVPNEKYCLAKLNTIFELIDRINLNNHCDFLDEIFKIKLGFYDRNQKVVDIKQLNKARNIMQNNNQSQSSLITRSALALIFIYLFSWIIRNYL
ncbi:unnamed protein product [Paramecium primaurelia]|uniref:Uncharacterized protein n=1 Tax=Paramecium primaurelia TaxID=5886 RepID=A0A8S1Q1W8_PARPR|nr:unnamed protein product [Paramecium primaurelia]